MKSAKSLPNAGSLTFQSKCPTKSIFFWPIAGSFTTQSWCQASHPLNQDVRFPHSVLKDDNFSWVSTEVAEAEFDAEEAEDEVEDEEAEEQAGNDEKVKSNWFFRLARKNIEANLLLLTDAFGRTCQEIFPTLTKIGSTRFSRFSSLTATMKFSLIGECGILIQLSVPGSLFFSLQFHSSLFNFWLSFSFLMILFIQLQIFQSL